MPTLMEAFAQVQQWLPQSGYRHGDGPEFEYYGEEFMADNATMALYIPVEHA